MCFLGTKYAKNAFAAGALPPETTGGAYSAPPGPLARFKAAYF